MTQPLHFTPKAIEAFRSYAETAAPTVAAGLRYLVDKLREAQVFVLSDSGQILDRSKPRPHVAGEVFRPPFPVVALEYTASPNDWNDPTLTRCSKRISLAWEWANDLPAPLQSWLPQIIGPGVVVASIAYIDEAGGWVPIPAAMHVDFADAWREQPARDERRDAMIASGQISKASLNSPAVAGRVIALLPAAIEGMAAQVGIEGAFSALSADLMDEVNAYTDLCLALACKNVGVREYGAPTSLNRARIRKGKLPLRGFHVLEVASGGDLPGAGTAIDRSAPRSHLRRGHIRRLSSERVTWVNASVVRGRGFVDKVYAV